MNGGLFWRPSANRRGARARSCRPASIFMCHYVLSVPGIDCSNSVVMDVRRRRDAVGGLDSEWRDRVTGRDRAAERPL